jgi:hypothetical protein
VAPTTMAQAQPTRTNPESGVVRRGNISASPRDSYRLPKPKHTSRGSASTALPFVGRKRSGLKREGLWYTASSLSMQLSYVVNGVALNQRWDANLTFAITVVPEGMKSPLYSSSSISRCGMPERKNPMSKTCGKLQRPSCKYLPGRQHST